MNSVEPRRELLGECRSPVITIDGLAFGWMELIDAAASLAPFPPARGIQYPGLRRVFGEESVEAWKLSRGLLESCAPYIAGGFDCDGFQLVEANFSLVTTAPDRLLPAQRHPHFDSTDPDFVALIVYLFPDDPDGGTAFYRHLGTGTETVSQANVERFVAAAKAEAAGLTGYFAPGDPGYAAIGAVAARFGRVGIWRGNLLHSGLVPVSHNFSPDPRRGRLTLNLFLQLRRERAIPR